MITPTITQEDMNGIDKVNGHANVSFKGVYPNGLKGALDAYNSSFSQYEEMMFIQNIRKQMFEFLTERFEYDGLPAGMNKYRLEQKTLENGSSLFYKVGDKYHMFRYTTLKFNMYDEPSIIKINEPKSSMHNKTIDLEKDDNGVIFDNNRYRQIQFANARRFIKNMENTLFQMEKNLFASAPKGLINLKTSELVDSSFDENGENAQANAMEEIINAERTFFAIRSKGLSKAGEDNEDDIFIPIELTDRFDSLLKQYTFYKEQIKEIIGAFVNSATEKKERLLQGEFNEQGITSASVQHAYEIRTIAIEKINEMYGLNITIDFKKDENQVIEESNQEDKGGDKDES